MLPPRETHALKKQHLLHLFLGFFPRNNRKKARTKKMTIDGVTLGPATPYRALRAVKLLRANYLRNSSQFY